MRENLPQLREWIDKGAPFTIATVIDTHGSAPRQPGALMAVARDGRVIGSISGGCVESAVYEAACEVLENGRPQLHIYGAGDTDAFEPSLTCGGTMRVLIQAFSETTHWGGLRDVLDAMTRQEPVAAATVVRGTAITGGGTRAGTGARLVVRAPDVLGSLGDPALDAAITDDARGFLAQGTTAVCHYDRHGGRIAADCATDADVEVFIQTFAPPPRMLIFGATAYAAATARMGAFLGYRVTVCDARPVFATRERFPAGIEVVRAWPHDYLAATQIDRRTVLCVLTHDSKFDIPLLAAALRSPAAYIGVMGSRRTHERRALELRDEGIDEAELSRLASPIGLDLGARTPEETAVSIAAEIIGTRWGGSGHSLSRLTGDIHHPAPEPAHR
ncbi:MAG TPA: XdhC/CoxI family protein [Actinocrinis sp.]|jgi:xanthine dehydrogenase accessory factor